MVKSCNCFTGNQTADAVRSVKPRLGGSEPTADGPTLSALEDSNEGEVMCVWRGRTLSVPGNNELRTMDD